MDEKITIPFDLFIAGVRAVERLEAIRAMVVDGHEFCSPAIERMLGIEVKDDTTN